MLHITLRATHGLNTAIGIRTGIVAGIILLMIGLLCIRIIIIQVERFDNDMINFKSES